MAPTFLSPTNHFTSNKNRWPVQKSLRGLNLFSLDIKVIALLLV